MLKIHPWCWFAFLWAPLSAWAETHVETLQRAEAAMHAAVPRAQADPARPIFHVTSPAQWINDPNGPIFHNGFYHLFYQLHPYSDGNGPKYWGHARSRDLARWEHLPIALAPSDAAGESGVWSGCATVNAAGVPMIFYTSVAHGKSALNHAEQWVATSEEDLIHWKKSPANPVLTEALHGATKIYDWRDPFLFRDGKKTFMVLGGSLNESKGGQAVVTLYEAEDAALMKWTYRGVLFQLPDSEARTAECPNFFQLGDEWVLFVSPYGKVQYFVGDFDATSGRFRPRTRGLLDHGPNFYAPNTLLAANGKRLVWGWVTGFPEGRGWNGCLSLPRQLSFSRDGKLQQTPAPQLKQLRGAEVSWKNVALDGEPKSFALPKTNTLEIETAIDLRSARQVRWEIASAGQAPQVTITYDGLELRVQDAKAQLPRAPGERELHLRVFVDRSVLEVFANDTLCFTKRIETLSPESTLTLQATGPAQAKRVRAWPMKTIW